IRADKADHVICAAEVLYSLDAKKSLQLIELIIKKESTTNEAAQVLKAWYDSLKQKEFEAKNKHVMPNSPEIIAAQKLQNAIQANKPRMILDIVDDMVWSINFAQVLSILKNVVDHAIQEKCAVNEAYEMLRTTYRMLSASPERKQDVQPISAAHSKIPLNPKKPVLCAQAPQYVTPQETLEDVRKKLRPVNQSQHDTQHKTEPVAIARQVTQQQSRHSQQVSQQSVTFRPLPVIPAGKRKLRQHKPSPMPCAQTDPVRDSSEWSVDSAPASECSLPQETVAARELLFNPPVRVARSFTPEEISRMTNHEAFIKPLIHERLKVLRNAFHDDDSDAE
ncbi:MAG TPA: hypothetical protein PKD74_04635, partial [Candidatus Dependentiae bacterium]|nr:hypothetical protein [Candidatus Dependentiae bacterium]